MKVLSIGNSFSQDAHKWLHLLATAHGEELETVNLYIGGCTLKTHWEHMEDGEAAYELERNGGACEQMVGISAPLHMAQWDVVTFQQASGYSGMQDSYEPYLTDLADYVRKSCPAARFYFHQTWAYAQDAEHPHFAYYGHDQRRMHEAAAEAADWAAEKIGAGKIPVGEVIQTLRETVAEFDYRNGGKSPCRDGFHLSLDYGRYAAAATWFCTLTGKSVSVTAFQDFDPVILEKINKVVNTICRKAI